MHVFPSKFKHLFEVIKTAFYYSYYTAITPINLTLLTSKVEFGKKFYKLYFSNSYIKLLSLITAHRKNFLNILHFIQISEIHDLSS